MTASAFLPRQAAHAERGADCYSTPPEAVHALLAVETIPGGAVWEPCCGLGNITRVLRAVGHEVYATDLVDYQSPDQDAAGIDFPLEHGSAPYYIGSIVTNPPYKLAAQFVRHALLLVPRAYMLLPLTFLESERRTAILESGWLKRVWIFRNRLPRMHRHNWDGPRSSSAVAFAWYCFDRENPGETTLHRLSWRAQP
jgi:hypothetical protein